LPEDIDYFPNLPEDDIIFCPEPESECERCEQLYCVCEEEPEEPIEEDHE